MNDEPICNCPLCGRTHRKMPFGTPPAVISDVVTIPRVQYEALMAAKEVLLHIATNDHPTQTLIDCPHYVDANEFAARQALAALRAAGLPEEKP